MRSLHDVLVLVVTCRGGARGSVVGILRLPKVPDIFPWLYVWFFHLPHSFKIIAKTFTTSL